MLPLPRRPVDRCRYNVSSRRRTRDSGPGDAFDVAADRAEGIHESAIHARACGARHVRHARGCTSGLSLSSSSSWRSCCASRQRTSRIFSWRERARAGTNSACNAPSVHPSGGLFASHFSRAFSCQAPESVWADRCEMGQPHPRRATLEWEYACSSRSSTLTGAGVYDGRRYRHRASTLATVPAWRATQSIHHRAEGAHARHVGHRSGIDAKRSARHASGAVARARRRCGAVSAHVPEYCDRAAGIRSGSYLLVNVNVARAGVEAGERPRFFDRIAGEIAAVPGVAHAAGSLLTPRCH